MPSKLSTNPKPVCNSSDNSKKGPKPRVLINARNIPETFDGPQTVCNSSYNYEKGPNPRVLINALETVNGGQNNMQ